MEAHSPVAAKRLWSYLRVAFFMFRKGLISKRKLVMDMNLKIKRGKLISKGLGNLVFHHHHQHRARPHGHGYGLQEYELSCNTSPNLVFFHAKRAARHSYFPCMAAVIEDEDEPPPPVLATAAPLFPMIRYSPQRDRDLPVCSPSPLSTSVIKCGSEEDEASSVASPESNNEVDNEAEVFIRRFYEQQRRQSRIALLQYELDYQEMLIRGR